MFDNTFCRYTATVSQNWRAKFEKMLKRYPQGVVGEIGLDWAKKIPSMLILYSNLLINIEETQKRIFEEQFAHAAGKYSSCFTNAL